MSRDRIRVTILHNLPAPYRLQWFERLLRDARLDVSIFLTGRSRSNRPYWSGSLVSEESRIVSLRGIGIPVKGVHNDRFNVNPGFLRVLERRPDVVLLFGYVDPTNLIVAFICHLRGIPYVLFAEVSDVWNRSLTARMAQGVIKRVVNNASWLAPASTSCARFFESLGGDPRSMSIIPCVPDIEPLTNAREARGGEIINIKKRMNIHAESVVLFIGRLIDFKGVQDAVEALRIVKQFKPDVLMVIVGKGPLETYVTAASEELAPSVLYFESVDEATLQDLYLIADVHIMPSWHEAFGVVCAEALGYGVPSIVTRTSGCSDLIIDGENGFLVNPKDPEHLAQTILKVLCDANTLASMKVSASQKSRDFSMTVIVDKVKSVIFKASESSKDGS
jgi:glycosyltransferase involved in cell wall biosynthesis